jgi:hypothetical protein
MESVITEYYDAEGLKHRAAVLPLNLPKDWESLACEVDQVAPRLRRSRYVNLKGEAVCTVYTVPSLAMLHG